MNLKSTLTGFHRPINHFGHGNPTLQERLTTGSSPTFAAHI